MIYLEEYDSDIHKLFLGRANAPPPIECFRMIVCFDKLGELTHLTDNRRYIVYSIVGAPHINVCRTAAARARATLRRRSGPGPTSSCSAGCSLATTRAAERYKHIALGDLCGR